MSLPNLFVIGAAKAGTTSLHFYLDQHPEIQMSAIKEPNFFSGPPGGNGYPLGRVEDLGDYEALFDGNFPLRGEASVGYSNFPRRQGVPESIKALVPEARFVYLVRDPVARIVSQYQYRVAMEGERRPIAEALADLDDPYSVYLCPGRYASQLENYLRNFEQDRILVVDHADLLGDRAATLASIFSFLGAEPSPHLAAFEEKLNTEDEKRAFSTGWVQTRERLKTSPLRLLPRGVRRGMRRSVERVFWRRLPPAQLDEDLRMSLQEAVAPEAERLRGLTGMSFPSWGV
jgi:hypothetical protein